MATTKKTNTDTSESTIDENRDGHLSTSNYVVAAKRMHLAMDHPWSGKYKLMYRECFRIAKRKLGPPRAARAFLLQAVAQTFQDNVPVVSTMVAPRIAARCGLVATMVWTHLPTNMALIVIPFAPSAEVAVAIWVGRALLCQ